MNSISKCNHISPLINKEGGRSPETEGSSKCSYSRVDVGDRSGQYECYLRFKEKLLRAMV